MSESTGAGRLHRDLALYYCYKATSAVTLYRPVMFLYFRALGLTWTQIAILEALGSLVTVGTEVPTGYVGDRIGRRNSMLIGTGLVAVALTGIGLAESFPALLLCYPLWSLGWNFRRGSDAAWLYDRLAVAAAADRFSEVRGYGVAAARGVGIVGALAGGVLGTRNLALPFLAAAVVTALGLPALLALRTVEARRERDRPSPCEAAEIVREALTDPRLAPFVGYYFVLFTSVVAVVFMFEQPVIEGLAVDASYAGSIEVLLGVLYAAISLVSAALSYYTGAVAERIGLRRWFATIPLAVGLGLLGILAVPILALPAILLARGVADVTRTLAGQYVNDRLGGAGRATVLSALLTVSSLAAIPFQIAAGRLADAGATTAEVLALAGAVLAVGVLLLARRTFSRFDAYAASRTN